MTGQCGLCSGGCETGTGAVTLVEKAAREYKSHAARRPTWRRRNCTGELKMDYSAMVDPVIPTAGFNASWSGRDNTGGQDDFLKPQSVFLGPDRASDARGAR